MSLDGHELIRGRDARSNLPAPLALAAGRHHTAETILRAWFEGKSDHTITGYSHDLEDFALYFSNALGLPARMTSIDALNRLFKQSAPSAHEVVLAFRNWMSGANLSSASINRHLATLRSVTKLGRQLGVMTWFLEVPSVKMEKRRVTAGPTLAQVRQMLDATSGDTEGEARDYAMVFVFVTLGLRVSELVGLDLERTDLNRGTTWIKGKGRRDRELVPIPLPTIDAIKRYLKHRGSTPGPLFQTRGQRGKRRDGRLETRSVLRIVRELGQRVGIHAWNHGLRHTAITTAIEAGQRAGVGLDQIRHFSRHRALATMLIYRDEHDREKNQRTIADVVAAEISAPTPRA